MSAPVGYRTYVLEPWLVVSEGPRHQVDGRLGVTVRWGPEHEDGGHVKLSREDAVTLRDALDAWLRDDDGIS